MHGARHANQLTVIELVRVLRSSFQYPARNSEAGYQVGTALPRRVVPAVAHTLAAAAAPIPCFLFYLLRKATPGRGHEISPLKAFDRHNAPSCRDYPRLGSMAASVAADSGF